MKKIIAASAALLLLGTMASTASAATITFSGDARARFYYKSDYIWDNAGTNVLGSGASAVGPTGKSGSEESYWQSRVRLVFKIETKGGAYAMGRFRLGDTYAGNNYGGTGGWDGSTASSLGTYNNNRGNFNNNQANFKADIAYVGIPLQGGFAIEAGLGPNTMDRFLRMDAPYNWIRGRYVNDQSGTTVLAFMEKLSEYKETQSANHGLASANGTYDDDDVNNYGLRLTQKLTDKAQGGWLLDATLLYLDDQQGDQNGYAAVARVTGKVGDGIGLYAGGAFKSNDYQNWLYSGTNQKRVKNIDQNGYGFFLGANVPIGIASIGITGGMTFNSFTVGGDFGGDYDGVPFTMLGYGSQNVTTSLLATGILIGGIGGNAWFVNVAPSVKVSDKLTLTAESTYVSLDSRPDPSYSTTKLGNGTTSLVEVGGIAQYQITDGAAVTAILGYLNIDGPDKVKTNNPLGAGVSLDLKF